MTHYNRSIQRLVYATIGEGDIPARKPIETIARSACLDVLALSQALHVADGLLNRGLAGGVLVRGRSFEQVANKAAAIIEAGFEDDVITMPGVPLDVVSEVVVAEPLVMGHLSLLREADLPDPRSSALNIGQYFVRVLSE